MDENIFDDMWLGPFDSVVTPSSPHFQFMGERSIREGPVFPLINAAMIFKESSRLWEIIYVVLLRISTPLAKEDGIYYKP
jgi:hypothetical protein